MARSRSVPFFVSSTAALLRFGHAVRAPCAPLASAFTPANTHCALVRRLRPRCPAASILACASAPSTASAPARESAKHYGDGATGSRLLDPAGEPLLHIVFVNPSIHWNTGNVGRTALGLGARLHLVGPLGFSLDERQVRRAGLDYWHHVDLRVYENWATFSAPGGPMEAIGGERMFFTKFGAEPAAEVEWVPEQTVVLVFGSEVNGFDNIAEWMEDNGKDERRVAFPMVDDRFRSFNLSTTASMALWDAWKSLTASRRKAAICVGSVTSTAMGSEA
jgi:tRNA (cytidine/uridine-2'-O-)-methyltransferase